MLARFVHLLYPTPSLITVISPLSFYSPFPRPSPPSFPTRRSSDLERQPADAEVAGHHPLAGDHLQDLEDLLALAEAIEENRHCAQIDGVRAKPYQVRANARQLGEQHADVLRALGDLQAEELLDRQAVAQIVGERRKIIQPIGQADGL